MKAPCPEHSRVLPWVKTVALLKALGLSDGVPIDVKIGNVAQFIRHEKDSHPFS